MMTFDLTHARHDPAHCLAPGLFRSLKRGDRKKLKLDVTYRYGNNELIEFSGPEPLGVDDLRVLQGLVALSGPNGIILRPEPKTEIGQQLRLLLETKLEAAEQDALVIKGSYRNLAHEIGYADIEGGATFRQIREIIERLWKVSIIVQSGKRRMGFRLLSDYASDEETGKLFIALNPRITEAVLGRRPHTRINMDEVRALRNDPARLIHQRLCGWINPSKIGRVELDTLCAYVWPDEANYEAIKKRRQTTKKALNELRAIGWHVAEYATNKFEITRPSIQKSRLNADESGLNIHKQPPE